MNELYSVVRCESVRAWKVFVVQWIIFQSLFVSAEYQPMLIHPTLLETVITTSRGKHAFAAKVSSLQIQEYYAKESKKGGSVIFLAFIFIQ